MSVQLTEQQKQDVRVAFASRRRRQLLAIVPGIAGVAAIGFGNGGAALGIPADALVVGGAVLILGLVAFSFRNWRCPSCDRYLGRSFAISYCPKCGVPLTGG